MQNKFVGVLGLGKSGKSTIDFLSANNIKYIAWDDGDKSEANLLDINDPAWLTIDYLLISPGIPTNYPQPHPLVVKLKQHSVPIISDIELLYRNNPNAAFVGITGTNGKSTTTALIGHILETNKIKNCVGGNIGIGALSLEPLKKEEVYVIETSSYQLELLESTHFNVSILLNITPDHLDRYASMKDYIRAKENIFRHQGDKDFAIVSIDNQHTKEIYQKLLKDNNISNIIPISTLSTTSSGVSLIDNILTCNIKEHTTIKLPEFPYLQGKHNAENIAASFAACFALGLDPSHIIDAIASFPGLKHRLQFVASSKGLKFFNDSKGTNAESTEKALSSFPNNIYWILGGLAKEGGIKTLTPYFSRIKKAFLVGDAEEEFAKELEGKVDYIKCGHLAKAFHLATEAAISDNSTEEKIILLSPACASLDQWKSFEERGNAFCKLAMEFCDDNK